MANYNKVILIGNLTRDPQLSYLPSQTPVVEFGLAVNRRWRGQDGQQKDETCFIDCRAYGRQAENIAKFLSKGRQTLVEGRLQFDTWEGKDGARRSKHRVIVERCQFLGGQGAAAGPQAPRAAQAPESMPPEAPPEAPPEQAASPEVPDVEEPPPSADDGDLGGGGDGIPF
jgi:single-strand DNA-binding protein